MDNLPSFDRQQLKAALRAAQRGSDYLHSLLNTIESCFNDEDWKLVAWIQPLSATLSVKDFRWSFESETLSRTAVQPRFDLC